MTTPIYKRPDPHLVSKLITQAKKRNPKEPITLILYPRGTWHLHEGAYTPAPNEVTVTEHLPTQRFSVKDLAKSMVETIVAKVPAELFLRKRQIPDGQWRPFSGDA